MAEQSITITLDSPEARLATTAAADHDGHLLLVPDVDGRTTTIGVIGSIEQTAELPAPA